MAELAEHPLRIGPSAGMLTQVGYRDKINVRSLRGSESTFFSLPQDGRGVIQKGP